MSFQHNFVLHNGRVHMILPQQQHHGIPVSTTPPPLQPPTPNSSRGRGFALTHLLQAPSSSRGLVRATTQQAPADNSRGRGHTSPAALTSSRGRGHNMSLQAIRFSSTGHARAPPLRLVLTSSGRLGSVLPQSAPNSLSVIRFATPPPQLPLHSSDGLGCAPPPPPKPIPNNLNAITCTSPSVPQLPLSSSSGLGCAPPQPAPNSLSVMRCAPPPVPQLPLSSSSGLGCAPPQPAPNSLSVMRCAPPPVPQLPLSSASGLGSPLTPPPQAVSSSSRGRGRSRLPQPRKRKLLQEVKVETDHYDEDPTLPITIKVQWKPSMADEMQEILPGLFLGPYVSAMNGQIVLNNLKSAGITHVVGVRQTSNKQCMQAHHLNYFKYLFIDVEDNPNDDLLPLFEFFNEYLQKCLPSGGRVLVHGLNGKFLSAAFVTAYVMLINKVTMEEAILFIRRKRKCCDPQKYIPQLRKFEWYSMLGFSREQDDERKGAIVVKIS